MNILVTGSNGQLGTAIKDVVSLSKDKNNWFFTDVDTLDITSKEQVFKKLTDFSIDVIINCAAYTNVDKAESDRKLAEKINCDGPKTLSYWAGKLGIKLIHISTDYVFDGKGCKPYSTADKPNPISVYGITKRMGEIAIFNNMPSKNAYVIRTAWLYYEGFKNFVSTMINLMESHDYINVVDDQVGTPTYAGDLANFIVNDVLKKHTMVPGGIYHYTNEGVCSWYDFAKMINEYTGLTTCEVMAIPTGAFKTPVERPHYSVLNKNSTKLWFKTSIPYWTDSLKKAIKKF